MEIQVKQGELTTFQADALVLFLSEGVKQLEGVAASVDTALGGVITDELAFSSAFTGKLGQTWVIHSHGKVAARYVILVGLGKAEGFGAFEFRRASAAAARACQRLKTRSAVTVLPDAANLSEALKSEEAARLLAEGASLGVYRFTKHQSTSQAASLNNDNGPEPQTLETLTVLAPDDTALDSLGKGLLWGRVIAENVNLARDWVFDSANHVTPSFLVEQARQIPGVRCNVLDAAAIREQGLNAFATVAQGSEEPPYLIHLTYQPAGTPERRIALVGKGITFDSGGLSLKPAGSMELMKDDMSGAAAVLATLRAISALQGLSVQVDTYIPTCENMPSGRACKPGDIVRAANGKTIEINNTDAEGRLILCDALTYAQREKPDVIIDLATLTGACVVALGKVASGIMGTDQALIDALRAAGDRAGEKFWQLPLYDEYKRFLKSDVADLINAGAKGEAGSSAAGVFLKEFIEEDRAWAHLDIAGPAYTSHDTPEVPKGATGVGVRTLLYYLYQL